MGRMLSGRQENLPYSLSRWTDLPAAKWDWFKARLAAGSMTGFDPRTPVPIPAPWSLRPEDTLGLVFWTKNPANLIKDAALLRPYRVKIHVTLTGWHEAEPDTPTMTEGAHLIRAVVDAFGPEAVTWRFSPIPMLPTASVLQRFWSIATSLRGMGLKRVYASFLHDNDLMPETRSQGERLALLWSMADLVNRFGFEVVSCNVDTTDLGSPPEVPKNLRKGVCEDGSTFGTGLSKDTCGCSLTVDPFMVNEACCYSCRYCYAADRSLSQIRRNTTKHA
jgi:hypothetical protein